MHDTILIYSKSHSYTYNQYLPEGLKARIKRHYRHKDDNGRLYSLDNPTANGLDGGGYSYEWKGVFRQWRFSKERMEELDRLGRLQDPKRPKGVVRIKRFLDEHKGVVVQDLWTDIPYVSYFSRERVPNYVGQKPVGLISRLIEMFSNPGDLVLDPFLGSGTTAIAAQRLRRQWLGFELTHKSAKVAFERIYKEFGTCCEKNVYPSDIEDARYLAKSDPHALERWVVRQIKGRHSGKKSADGGIDGTLELLTFAGPVRFVVQVTGGANISDHFGNFVATVLTKHKAGLYFAFRDSITDSMRVRAFNSGSLVLECRGDSYSIPKIQIVEIETTLSLGNSPLLPGLVVPYNYDQTHEAMERRSKEQMAMMLQGML
jgi:site-specific DNA-methyltransferase (adenine-specific)